MVTNLVTMTIFKNHYKMKYYFLIPSTITRCEVQSTSHLTPRTLHLAPHTINFDFVVKNRKNW